MHGFLHKYAQLKASMHGVRAYFCDFVHTLCILCAYFCMQILLILSLFYLF